MKSKADKFEQAIKEFGELATLEYFDIPADKTKFFLEQWKSVPESPQHPADQGVDRKKVFEVIATVKAQYPASVFPENSESQDAKSARVARLICDNIKREMEIMFNDEGSAPTAGELPEQKEIKFRVWDKKEKRWVRLAGFKVQDNQLLPYEWRGNVKWVYIPADVEIVLSEDEILNAPLTYLRFSEKSEGIENLPSQQDELWDNAADMVIACYNNLGSREELNVKLKSEYFLIKKEK